MLYGDHKSGIKKGEKNMFVLAENIDREVCTTFYNTKKEAWDAMLETMKRIEDGTMEDYDELKDKNGYVDEKDTGDTYQIKEDSAWMNVEGSDVEYDAVIEEVPKMRNWKVKAVCLFGYLIGITVFAAVASAYFAK